MKNLENITTQKCVFCKNTFNVRHKYDKSNHLISCKEWKYYKENVLTKDYLIEEYVNKKRAAIEIANEHGVASAISIIKLLKKYGIKTRSIKDSISLPKATSKREQTCVKKYGVKNPWCRNSKWVLDYLQKNNINNPFQLESVKDKIKQHNLMNYGVEYNSQRPEVAEKYRNTMLAKYGVPYGIFLTKTTITIPHKKLIDYLNEIGIKCKVEESIGNYRVDILVDNKIIEIYGDFYHANPLKYKENDILHFPKGNSYFAKDIWKKDKHRKIELCCAGYDMLEIWEYDINNNFENTKEQICQYLK